MGKQDRRGERPLLLISRQGDLLSSGLLSVEVEHDCLAERVLVKFSLLHSYSSCLFLLSSLEGSHCVQLTLKEWGVMLHLPECGVST